MKKNYMFLIFICIFLVGFSGCKQNKSFDAGKDTIKMFGDGTYQILHQVKDGKNVEILSNCRYNQCVLTSINKYYEKDNTIYFIGNYYEKSVKCILDSNENVLKYYVSSMDNFVMVYGYDMQKNGTLIMLKSIDEFSKNEIEIFNNME